MTDTRERRTPAWLIVMRREILAKLTDRTFLTGTLITLSIIAGAIGIQAYLGERTKTYQVASTSADRSMADRVADRAHSIDTKVKMSVVAAADDAAARQLVDDDTADVWLHNDNGTWVLTGRTGVPSSLEAVTAQVVRDTTLATNAAAAGTSVDQITRGSEIKTAQIVGDPQRSDLNSAVGFAMAFLFYIAAVMFGLALASSVVEEKQSRIVEIIASAIPVRQLLAGKVLGNSLIAMGQILVYAGVGLVGLSFTDLGRLLPSVTGPILWFVVFFVIGFLAIACLYAVAGALASRTEDLQSTTMPLTMLVMVVFFASAFLNGTAATICSFIPPLSAVMMPVRLLDGGVPLWQPLVALAGLVAFAGMTIVIGERLYKRALLQTQGRTSVRAAWAATD